MTIQHLTFTVGSAAGINLPHVNAAADDKLFFLILRNNVIVLMKRTDSNGGNREISISEGVCYGIILSAEEIQNFPSGNLTYILFTPGDNRTELFSGLITVSGFENRIAINTTIEYVISQEFNRDDEFSSIIPVNSVITSAIVKLLSGSGCNVTLKYGHNGNDATRSEDIRECSSIRLDVLRENCLTTDDPMYVTSGNWDGTTLKIWLFYKKVI